MVLYNGFFEIDTAFYPSVNANFKVSRNDAIYTTQAGLSAIVIKVALTDELFLKVCGHIIIHEKKIEIMF